MHAVQSVDPADSNAGAVGAAQLWDYAWPFGSAGQMEHFD